MPSHPHVDNMQRSGHKSFRELLDEAMEENRYIEDIYGDEIKHDDEYYINEHDELIHSKNLAQYALDACELHKKTR